MRARMSQEQFEHWLERMSELSPDDVAWERRRGR